MISFKSFALALFLISQCNASTENQSLRASAARRLSFEAIAGYPPRSQVTDHAAIDLDQAAIEAQLSVGTTDSFLNAKAIYEEGGYSKSFARVDLDSGLTADLAKDTQILGTSASGDQIAGKAKDDFPSGSTEIEFQYQTSDVQASYVDCQVGALQEDDQNLNGCLAAAGELTIGGDTYTYTYAPTTDNNNGRTIQGFSTAAESKLYRCDNCPYDDYNKFFNYYGQFDYANQWVLAALEGKSTSLENGNANFDVYGFPGRTEAVKKGTAYMNVWMYVIREFEDALDDCQNNCIDCNAGGVHAWDEGVAFYTGSLEGQDGSGDGKLVYALADKRSNNFKTCGVDGNEAAGTSKVNYDLLAQFALGKQNLLVGNCKAARENKERIAQLMAVPLVQGTIRYAWITDKEASTSGEKEAAEGAVFAAAILPIVHHCSDAEAKTIYDNMAVGSSTTDFSAVKSAFESCYANMGITCADVGGYWNDAAGEYFEDASPCRDSSNSSSDKNTVGIVLGSIAGAVAVVAIGSICFLRRREKQGNPVFAPSKPPPDSAVHA